MLLNNFNQLLHSGAIKSISGTVAPAQTLVSSYCLTHQFIQNGTGGGGIWLTVGGGDTPVTPSDYALASPISYIKDGVHSGNLVCSGLTWAENGVIVDTGSLFGVTATYANNTQNAITVKEVGVNAWVYATNEPSFLIARKVLDTPVTIEPGKAYTFSYQVRIPITEQ